VLCTVFLQPGTVSGKQRGCCWIYSF